MRSSNALSAFLLIAFSGCSTATRTPDPAQSPLTTRAWSGEDPDLTTGDVSPDGRYFTDIEWGRRMSAPLAWTPDGSRLILELTDETDTPALWSLGIRGGEPLKVLAGCCRENDVRLDRQGRRMAFAAGADRGEIWFLQY